jgi:hypothetical protein
MLLGGVVRSVPPSAHHAGAPSPVTIPPLRFRRESRSSSSGVQRILGITQSFSSLQPEPNQTTDGSVLCSHRFNLDTCINFSSSRRPST